MERALTVIQAPLMTEKSTIASQFRQYGFKTLLEATKPEIKSAIEQIFKVKVVAVNTLLQKGKTKRFKGREGRRSDYKKAIVTLAEGHTIDVGAGL
ncbi:MAG: 50S ribosomal protein L23 [Candidatus Paracaedimonas acanthamoebae]|uniref:Large ribosomal subunit protein uL23 n=1 Tax=Candidatus Paracaedimonas acanthamoebae TaxID=244581 RepID=A0A8J7TTR8_9PROT|nr:50S ribosomal protein L23 [Candidatus Paracaedimonas acanthamoebae]